ncbi:MAG: hypothetical protein QW806_09825 [Nitrososphaerota archaeon]
MLSYPLFRDILDSRTELEKRIRKELGLEDNGKKTLISDFV